MTEHRRHPTVAAQMPGQGRPGAAAMTTDAESGTEALDMAEDKRRALYALQVMFDRGLFPAAEYEQRKAALTRR